MISFEKSIWQLYDFFYKLLLFQDANFETII